MTRLTDRLQAARKKLFVGRTAERSFFEEAISADEMPFCVLHISGLGGVGKTTLLREFASLCAAHNVHTTTLDARNLDPSPEAFLGALAIANGLPPGDSPVEFLAQLDTRYVIFIDTYEMLAPLDGWLREQFVPQLPDNGCVVLAGRNPPRPEWRLDAAWQNLLCIVALRNLSREESHAYLLERNIPEKQHEAILDFTHGHPLALSLTADLIAQQKTEHQPATLFTSESAPDVVKVLVEHLVQGVPGERYRAAIEACALVRLTTESLLGELLPAAGPDEPAAHELFEWLRGLSFVDSGPAGVFPHDLAREAIVADLRWRDPQWYAELHHRARNCYTTRLQQSSGQQQQNILIDYIFLHRSNSVVRPFLEWQENGSLTATHAEPEDVPALLEMVTRHEGAESARIAGHWFERQLAGVLVMRDGAGAIAGFMAQVALHETSAEDAAQDPGVARALHYLRAHAPLRAGEAAIMFRFWMDRDSYQSVSATQSLIFVNIVRQYLTTPALAFTFLPCVDADFWAPIFAYAHALRLPEVDFTIGDKCYGTYGHDWRVMPPMAWLGRMADQEISDSLAKPEPPPVAEQLVVLSEPEFASAVHAAFRHLLRPAELKNNPLLRSRLVVERAASAAGTNVGSAADTKIRVLQDLLESACDELKQSPRSAKFYGAICHTYLRPAASQEQAADLLDVPFSTFRRHLKSGLEHVTAMLWQQEIGG